MPRRGYFALLFFSGFCALTYETVWLRLAFAEFGINTEVISIVLSVFMAGLAIGASVFAPWLIHRAYTRRIPLLYYYAAVEAGIGIGGLAIPHLFALAGHVLLQAGQASSGAYLGLSAVLLALSLLPWCVLMGATIPLVMSVMRRQGADPTSFSYLYLANTLGALAGLIITVEALIEVLGFFHTLLVAVVINGGIAAAAVLYAYLWRVEGIHYPSVRGNQAFKGGRTYALLFVTGFISLAHEVIWNRQFTPILHTSVYAFGLILSFYLISNSLGLAWYRYSRRRGWLVSIRLLAAILFFACVAQLWLGDPRLHLGILGVILSVSTISLVLGYLTARQIDDLTGGDPIRAGRAYAVNMLGCIVGPLAAAYVLLPFIGTHLSIVVLALPVLPFLIGGREKASFIFFGTAVAAVLLAFSTPFARTYEEFLPGTFKVIKYDYNATVVAATRPTGEKELIVNGVPMTTLTPITKVMAHLPLALLDQPPESALILCLGMGTTFRSASAWGITTTAVELTPSVAAFFPYFFADAGRVLADPRHRIVVDDGRRYLERTSGRYDLIVIDPPPPVEAAGSSLLYSQQFYALAKGRMTNGGILAQWFPGARGADLDAVITALRAVFPYVAAYSSVEGWGYHLFASQEPIPDLTPDEFAAKLSPAAAKDLMEWNPFGDPDLHAFAARIVAGRQNIESIVSDPHSQAVVTDDRPFTEYYLLRSVWGSAP